MTVDEETFNELMQKQRELARNSRKASDGESWKSDGFTFNCQDTEFLGYTEKQCEATVLEKVEDGEKASIVLDKTVFYGESGGQVGDTGYIKGDGFTFKVTNTTKSGGIYTHFGVVEQGEISVGDKVSAAIDVKRRNAIRRNHTAAHLLQAALRQVLGTHVEQAGQLVNEHSVRFDFTHFSALTAEELKKVEEIVNEVILDGVDVENREMPIEEAKKLGAMALFGEKYGDVVRVVSVADFSTELCGGTHVDNSGKLGLFRITTESSVAAGVRRIEAVTGANVLDLLYKYKSVIDETAAVLKSPNPMEIALKATQLAGELKETAKKVESLEAAAAGAKLGELMNSAKEVNGVKIICALLNGTPANELRSMCDKVKGDNADAVCLIASVNEDKLTFCAACGKNAIAKGANAGNIVRAVAKIADGNGGGKPDSAMAGGKDISKAQMAVDAAFQIISEMIEG